MLIPLYGFLQGDTIGLLVLAQDTDTIASVANKLQSAARVRVASRAKVEVLWGEKVLHPNLTVAQAGLSALQRIDVREAHEHAAQ